VDATWLNIHNPLTAVHCWDKVSSGC